MPLPATHVGNEHLKTYSPSGDITETSLAVKLERLANVGCKALTATEPLIPYHQIKHRLRDYFRNAKEGAKFAYHENSKEAPNPGLHLWGHGMVGFPLPEGDIERVKAASASMMVAAIDAEDIDMETMNSWQIPQGLWETRNPYWEVFLKSMLEKINCALEIKEFKRGIRHIKSSLILYEPGSIVETNDTPTLSPSAFGIFEAALPSQHGDIWFNFQYGGRENNFCGRPESEYDCSCLAWFPGVSMTSTRLCSGYRLVLRYTLEHAVLKPIYITPMRTDGTSELNSMLSS
ncbi:hypothetical protein BDZ45DRAFT_67964 [Acephala macrosclerotiorum]|nr:hypothetical protein BDZ45DRAFT_67964 [Acephala macrosclerotiorum]